MGRPGRLRRCVVVAATLVALLGLAACGDDGDGGPLTPGQAIDREDGGEIAVQGHVLSDADGTYLCSGLLESFPPQCGAPAVSVGGLDLATVDGLAEEGSVRWSERPVRLTGRMVQGVLSVEGPAATVDGSAG